jgi:hypothetical protein
MPAMRKIWLPVVVMLMVSWLLATPAQASEGHPSGPCVAPHDAPTVGGYQGGDANTQTYTAPNGRTVKRLCVAVKLSDGRLDHLSHYANFSDSCYQLKGVGTNQVTVKRVAETYQVPDWQTGPEAGKCQPLTHLDLFLSQPAATATPTSSPTAIPSPTTPTSGSSSTANPTPSPTAAVSPRYTSPSTAATSDQKSETTQVVISSPVTKGKVLGASDSAENIKVTSPLPNAQPAWIWWFGCGVALFIVLILLIWLVRQLKKTTDF